MVIDGGHDDGPSRAPIAPVARALSDDTYDQLGRVTERAINGSANTVTWAFDALGRVTSETNLLGAFTYVYDGVTNRLATVTYPNGQTSSYSYFNSAGDHRLQTIHHKYPSGGLPIGGLPGVVGTLLPAATLSKFDYTYDAVGNILTWRQQADSTAVLWKYSYDPADQLISAVKHATDAPQTILQRFAYAYDPAGNRTVEQIDDAVTLSAYDTLNRLTSQAPGGPMVVMGALNEPGTVTISGVPVTVDANNNFRGTVPTTTGTNAFTIVARDATGNTTTEQYEVDVAGTGKTFSYDANGNLTTDGTATFEWDARNLLVGRIAGSLRTEWDRNAGGFTSATRVITNSVLTSEQTAISCGLAPCEERISAGATTRYFPSGRSTGTTNVFYQLDHLSSVRSTSSSAGAILGRADFDPFGRADNVSVADQDVSFASLRSSGDASLNYDAAYRRYSPSLGRWLSEDPMGFTSGSSNWYAYADSQVLTAIDPSGLVAWDVDTKITEVITTMLGAAAACKAANPLCGCATSKWSAGGKCSCVNGAYKMELQLSYKNPTIHLARDAWTPLWVIRRHEQAHVSDAISVLQNRRVAGEALEAKSYSSQAACERDMADWTDSVKQALQGATRKRDFLVGKFCR